MSRVLSNRREEGAEEPRRTRLQRITDLDPWIGLWPCLYYMFIEYARPMVWIFPPLKLIKPGMIAVLWGFGAAVFSSARRPLPRTMRWILAFVALMVFQIAVATNNRAALEKLQLDFLPMVLGIALPLAVLPNSVRAMRIVLTGFFAVHILTATFGISSGGYGPGGWFGDQNDLAFALNTAIGVGSFLFLEARAGKRRIWIGAGLAVMVTAVIVSFSRGGLLGLTCVAGFVFMSAKRSRGPIVALLLIGILAVFLFAPAEWWEEMGTIDEAADPNDTGGKRLYYWEIGWKMFLDHPITGVGTENYGIRAPEYRDTSRYKESMWKRVAHSLYFTLLPEHGLVGTFIFLMMLRACYQGHRRLKRRFLESPEHETRRTAGLLSSGLASGLAASLVTGTFVSVLYYPPVWVAAAMIGSLTDVADREEEAEAADRADAAREAS